MSTCKGTGCTTKPRDPTAIFCSKCRDKAVNKAYLAMQTPAPVPTLVPTLMPTPVTVPQLCRGQPGCTVKPKNGDICSVCKRKAAAASKKAEKSKDSFTSEEAMAARQVVPVTSHAEVAALKNTIDLLLNKVVALQLSVKA